MNKGVLRTCWLAGTVAILASAFAAAAPGQRERPKIAVLPFLNQSGNPRWDRGGAQAAQDVFVTELRRSGRFQPLTGEQLPGLSTQNASAWIGRDPARGRDRQKAIQLGKQLGVRYLLTGAVTEYGVTDKAAQQAGPRRGARAGARAGGRPFVARMKANLIDTSTGEVVWADEARHKLDTWVTELRGGPQSGGRRVVGFGGGVDDERMFRRGPQTGPRGVSVGGFGGGVDDERLFNRAAKPVIQQLTRKLTTAQRSFTGSDEELGALVH